MLTKRWNHMNFASVTNRSIYCLGDPTGAAVRTRSIWRKQKHPFRIRVESGTAFLDQPLAKRFYLHSCNRWAL
jgi:hypothetical protein